MCINSRIYTEVKLLAETNFPPYIGLVPRLKLLPSMQLISDQWVLQHYGHLQQYLKLLSASLFIELTGRPVPAIFRLNNFCDYDPVCKASSDREDNSIRV